MNQIIVLFLLTIGIAACKNSEKEIDKLEIAKQYYKVLDNSDIAGIATLLSDSVVIRENEDDYEEVFSQKGYVEWLKWDSVFDPTYKVHEIKLENGIVNATISKMDKRISFLHEKPIAWKESIRFDYNKIIRVERTKYTNFDIPKFIKNRDKLSGWIEENNPELDGFLNDQTKSGGKNYLKAIELYKIKDNVLQPTK